MPKTAALSVRVDSAVKAATEAAAAADRRSTASLVEKVLVDWLRANGYLPK